MAKYLNVIVNNLKNEKCVLMLGPDVLVNQDGVSLQQGMFQYFETETDLKIERDIDNLIIFKNKSSKTYFHTDFKKYYEKNVHITDLHKQIAQIPFHLVISISPDYILKTAYEYFGINADFQYYSKKRNSKEIRKPDGEHPLLYNLFGSITDEDSLIITHDDLFEFIFAILKGEKKLPRELQNTLAESKVFVFLGFDFEKWYMKLILRLFELHKEYLPISSETKGKLDEKIKNFYINNFEMEFIPFHTNDLVNDLYKECEKLNMLREVKQITENPISSKVRDCIKNDELEQALDILYDYLENKDDDLFNTVTLVMAKFNRLKKDRAKGTVDVEVETAKIRDSLVSIADQVKRL